MAATQFGLQTIPPLHPCVARWVASNDKSSGFTSGTISGTSGSMRKALALLITSAPASAN